MKLLRVCLLLMALFPAWHMARSQSNIQTTIFRHDPSYTEGNAFFNHAASVERLPNGELVAAWSGGLSEAATDSRIFLSRSPDGGQNWSTPIVIVNPPGSALAASPLLFQHTNKLWLIWAWQPDAGAGVNAPMVKSFITTSTDGGNNWSESVEIPSNKYRFIGPLFKPEHIDGRLGFAYYWRDQGNPQTHVGILLASDDLTTWEERGDVFISGRRLLEPVLTREPDGRLILFMRSDLKDIYSSQSTNAGVSWTSPVPLRVPNPDTLNTVRRLSNGRYLVAWIIIPTIETICLWESLPIINFPLSNSTH